MDENKVEGTVRDAAGKVQDAVGGLTGDAKTQVEGKARQVYGQAQANYGDAMDAPARWRIRSARQWSSSRSPHCSLPAR